MPLFTPLPTPQEMTRWDRSAMDEFGIIPEMLMENASREAFHALAEATKNSGGILGKRILFFMGPGNNGGDAACMARHCHDNGAIVQVLHTRAREDYRNEAGYHFRLAARAGVSFRKMVASTLSKLDEHWKMPHIIVDGLLGTGFSGALRDDVLGYVRWINKRRDLCHIFSIDTPTGLNGLSGQPEPDAVQAHTTVTFEAAKTGLAMPYAAKFTGKLMIRRIGIPAMVQEKHPTACELMDHETVRQQMPAHPVDMHKGTAGRVLIIGGSEGMTGAPHLAALGAMRGGAGYVTLAAPAGLIPAITGYEPDFLTLPLGNGTSWTTSSFAELEPRLAACESVVVGPGLGRSAGAGAFLEWLLSAKRPATVFDADALFWLSERPELLDYCQESDILTPHPAEAARLIETQTAHVQHDRLQAARLLTERTKAVVVLKGAGTIIAQQARAAGETASPMVLSPFAVPNLAVAGSGDVLAGLASSHAAWGTSSRLAACLAVYEHGLAGKLLQQDFAGRGNSAQDIAHTIPKARKELLTC